MYSNRWKQLNHSPAACRQQKKKKEDWVGDRAFSRWYRGFCIECVAAITNIYYVLNVRVSGACYSQTDLHINFYSAIKYIFISFAHETRIIRIAMVCTSIVDTFVGNEWIVDRER